MSTVLITEITAVLSALLALVAAGILAIRNAVVLKKNARGLQQQAQPKVIELMEAGNAAGARLILVSEKADVLQRRSYALMVTMGKMWVLVSALREANQKVSRVLRYVGL